MVEHVVTAYSYILSEHLACGHSLLQCIISASALWSQPTSLYYLSIRLVVTAYFNVLSEHLP